MTRASTTSPTPIAPLTGAVVSRLRRLRARITTWFLVDGLSRLLLWLVLLIVADLLLDWLFHMDRAQRAVMLVLVVAVLAVVFYRRLARPLSRKLSDDAICLTIEDHHEQLGESLISAVQLSRMSDFESRGVSSAMVGATIRQGVRAAEQVTFREILRTDRFLFNLVLLAVTGLSLTGLAVASALTEPMAIWFNRNVMLGERQWPEQTYLLVRGVQDGRLIIPRGDDWPLQVTVKEESRRVPDTLFIDYRTATGRRTEPMDKQLDERTFRTTLKNVVEEFRFRVRSDRSATEWFQVQLVDRPAVAQLQLAVTPPRYAGGKTERLPPGKGPYYVLKGSRLSVRGTANKPLSSAVLTVGSVRRQMTISDLRDFRTTLPPEQLAPAVCQIELADTLNMLLPERDEPGPLVSKRPARFTIKIRDDREPLIQARLDGISSMVVPEARIPVVCRIRDDFAVTGVRLSYRWRGEDSTPAGNAGVIPLDQLDESLGRPEVSFDYPLELTPLKIPAGSGLSLQVEADDNDDVSGPKTGKSTVLPLRVVSAAELRTDLLRREKEQRQEFQRLLKHQEDILTECRAMLAATRDLTALPPEQRQSLVKFQKRQKLLGTNLAGIVRRLDAIISEVINNKLEEADGPLQHRLRERIINPMRQLADEAVPLAARQLDQTRRLSGDATGRNKVLEEAIAEQQHIAATMREILRHMVEAEGFREAVNLLYEIQRTQRDVFKLTDEERRERIRKILEQGGKSKD